MISGNTLGICCSLLGGLKVTRLKDLYSALGYFIQAMSRASKSPMFFLFYKFLWDFNCLEDLLLMLGYTYLVACPMSSGSILAFAHRNIWQPNLRASSSTEKVQRT